MIGLPNPLPPIVCAPDKTTISCVLLSTKYNFSHGCSTSLHYETIPKSLRKTGNKQKNCLNITKCEVMSYTDLNSKIKNEIHTICAM